MDEFYEAWNEVYGRGEGAYLTDPLTGLAGEPNTTALFERIRSSGSQYEHLMGMEGYAAYIAEGANPGRMVTSNRAMGIQDSGTRGAMRASGFVKDTKPECGCKGQTGECKTGGGRTAQLYPATRVPKLFQATHQRVRGWHNVYVGSTMIAQFSRKQSANVFCRSWNDMMKHLGSAASFDIPTLTFMFNSVIDGGSGAWGLKNGFDPPMHGTGGTVPNAA